MPKPHILIVGAGIVGLLLAQALKKEGIPFTVFERDPNPDHRGKGWGLTIHWALDTLLSLLPQHIVDRLPESYVNPEAVKRGENGNFLFYDLSTGEAKWQVPAARRIRVSRERLRRLLMEGIEVQWSKNITGVSFPTASTVVATFDDSATATGTHLIGCDGTHSAVRRLVCPDHQTHHLPVRFLGLLMKASASQVQPMLDLDPYFLQGGDPATNAFLWFSVLLTPESTGNDEYECQVMIAWPYRAGFLGRSESLDVSKTSEERLELMQEISLDWRMPFRELISGIEEGTEVKEIKLEDWVPPRDGWDSRGGRVTLMGDAAHAMVMFRGEGTNHGVTDVAKWLEQHLQLLKSEAWEGKPMNEACRNYQSEMIERARTAVLSSRRACLDAVDYQRIDGNSPLVSKRAIVSDS